MVGESETMRAGLAVMVTCPLAALTVTGNAAVADEAGEAGEADAGVADRELLTVGVPPAADVEDAEHAARPVTPTAASAA
jgi:hypothetical protein